MNPTVSIIVPCFNEQATIRHLLESVSRQTYPLHLLELVISDGLSTDNTRAEIAGFCKDYPRLSVRIVDNTARTIPASLNQALQAATGEVIIRLDAHSAPIPEYVQRCVAALQSGKGDIVGGVWEIRPAADGWIAHAISLAAAHPLGVGDALYRLNAPEGAVDTVPFGSFKRSLIDKIGAFDESLLTNEDYEFNTRLRKSGGVVWLDPTIRSVYFSRATLPKLAAQYWRYGFWKFRMLQRHPATLRWRQALPPLFAFALYTLMLLSLFFGFARWLLAAQLIGYFFILGLAGLQLAFKKNRAYLIIGIPLAIATMHLAWGTAFLWSVISSLFIQHG